MKLLAIILPLITFTAFAQDRTPSPELCQQMLKYGNEKLEIIRKDIAAKRDIDKPFAEIENLIKDYPDCVSYKKLKLKDNEIAGFRKHTYAYDRSFNLDEKSCTKYEVDTSNMPKNNNQGPLSWCFAFATADIVSFHEKKRISAYDIALHYHLQDEYADNHEKLPNSSARGGSNPDGILYAMTSDKGVCLEDDFKYSDANWEKLSEMMKNLVRKDTSLRSILCENTFNEREMLSGLSEEVITILDKLSPTKRASAVMDIQCKNRHKVKSQYELETRTYVKGKLSKEKLMEDMDKVLEKGEPVSIAYSADLLSDGVNFQGEPNHGSAIIGRKFNPTSGQCEYLIKNSWGDSDCQMTSSIRCEKGNYWVPRTALKNNIFQITYVNKKD